MFRLLGTPSTRLLRPTSAAEWRESRQRLAKAGADRLAFGRPESLHRAPTRGWAPPLGWTTSMQR
eukprot:13179231-Alexandrium_andersonii.AAC.1